MIMMMMMVVEEGRRWFCLGRFFGRVRSGDYGDFRAEGEDSRECGV